MTALHAPQTSNTNTQTTKPNTKPLHYTTAPWCSIHIFILTWMHRFLINAGLAQQTYHMVAVMLNQAMATIGVDV